MTKEELTNMIGEAVKAQIKALNLTAQPPAFNMADYLKAINAPQEVKTGKGEKLGRMIRALALYKGNAREAIGWLETPQDQTREITGRFPLTDVEYQKQLEVAGVMKRSLMTNPAGSGGFLVPEEFSTELIEYLRPRSVIRKLGPRIVPMPVGSIAIPRLSATATASYEAESSNMDASQETVQQLRLTWKKLKAIVPISNELLRYSNPSADMMVRDDLVLSMATAEDQAFIRGTGMNGTPRGLRYWAPSANVNNSSGTALANVDADFKTNLNALEGNNVRMISPKWIMSPRSKNFLSLLRTSLGPLAYPTITDPTPTLFGWEVGITNNIPNNLSSSYSEVYLADFADVLIGEATEFLIEVSNEAAYIDSNGTLQSAFGRDETVVKAVARHDFAMRHDYSVAVLSQVAWT